MNRTQEQIIGSISTFIGAHSDRFEDWYVGSASNVPSRLFNEHKVKEFSDFYISFTANSADAARAVVKHFVERTNTDGELARADGEADQVYAYKKSSHTDQSLPSQTLHAVDHPLVQAGRVEHLA